MFHFSLYYVHESGDFVHDSGDFLLSGDFVHESGDFVHESGDFFRHFLIENFFILREKLIIYYFKIKIRVNDLILISWVDTFFLRNYPKFFNDFLTFLKMYFTFHPW